MERLECVSCRAIHGVRSDILQTTILMKRQRTATGTPRLPHELEFAIASFLDLRSVHAALPAVDRAWKSAVAAYDTRHARTLNLLIADARIHQQLCLDTPQSRLWKFERLVSSPWVVPNWPRMQAFAQTIAWKSAELPAGEMDLLQQASQLRSLTLMAGSDSRDVALPRACYATLTELDIRHHVATVSGLHLATQVKRLAIRCPSDAFRVLSDDADHHHHRAPTWPKLKSLRVYSSEPEQELAVQTLASKWHASLEELQFIGRDRAWTARNTGTFELRGVGAPPPMKCFSAWPPFDVWTLENATYLPNDARVLCLRINTNIVPAVRNLLGISTLETLVLDMEAGVSLSWFAAGWGPRLTCVWDSRRGIRVSREPSANVWTMEVLCARSNDQQLQSIQSSSTRAAHSNT